MSDQRSSLTLVISVLVMGGVCGGLFVVRNCKGGGAEQNVEQREVAEKNAINEKNAEIKPTVTKGDEAPKKAQMDQLGYKDADQWIENFESALMEVERPEELAHLFDKLGMDELEQAEIEKLYQRIGKKGSKLRLEQRISEVGELQRKMHSRWSLNFADGSRSFFDLKKGKDGKWKLHQWLPEEQQVKKLDDILEQNQKAQQDSLMLAHSFVQFAMKQEFKKAKQLVIASEVSDVQLAGLCILFEEGEYALRAQRALLCSFSRDTRAGYMVNVLSKDGTPAQFSLLLKRNSKKDAWRVSELNFSGLLEAFITSQGGDHYYSPFVKNPKGGQSIVVYFDFDKNELSPRTKRQLNIVASILKLSDTRKITISGHTDVVGGKEYNQKLSIARANAVRAYLISQGVGEGQVSTIGYGAYRPRVANTLADGSDNPDGRKVNRRTEIYLDF